MTPLRPDAETQALVASLRAWLGSLPEASRYLYHPQLWRGLADLGVLGIGSAAAGGDAMTSVFVAEELGRQLVGGPVVAATLAAHLFEPALAEQVVAGTSVVAVGGNGLFPWGDIADVLVESTSDGLRRIAAVAEAAVVGTLDGEHWLRVGTSTTGDLIRAEVPVAHADVVLAGYLSGATLELVRRASDHARDRRQFGQAIGEFQAIAHPLAECFATASAATDLARAAAARLASGPVDRASTGMAVLACTAAGLQAARTAHQVFGALGYTVEGGVARFANRIRQWSLMPPGPDPARQRVWQEVVRWASPTIEGDHNDGS